jgi:Uma2 family endonuclease
MENGDRLSRDEFERRYAAMPKHIKAELIEGVVYMASPVKLTNHASPDGRLIGWIYDYVAETPGIDFGSNATVRLRDEDEPQPDCSAFILPELGGNVRISEDGYIENGPELVVEVAASSTIKDLGPKKRVYAANGIREYLICRPLDNTVDWFVLRDGAYEALPADANGVIRSEVFPGLWLNVPALLAFDIRGMKATSKEGLQSPEHAAFVAELESRRGL